MNLQWKAFGSSKVAHMIDVDSEFPRRSGPRALCGQYPGRRYEAWFSVHASEDIDRAVKFWGLVKCLACEESTEQS